MLALVRNMVGDHPARPVLVVSNDPTASGLARATDLGIKTAAVDHHGKSRSAFESDLVAVLDAAKPDVICLAGFMRILTPSFVMRYQGRMLNIHPSLLPKYPGLHTHQRALDAGDTQAGCSVHLVTPDLDAGPILGQARVDIAPDDTAETLAAKVLVQEHILYPFLLHQFVTNDHASPNSQFAR